jgi:hypothetical protein
MTHPKSMTRIVSPWYQRLIWVYLKMGKITRIPQKWQFDAELGSLGKPNLLDKPVSWWFVDHVLKGLL